MSAARIKLTAAQVRAIALLEGDEVTIQEGRHGYVEVDVWTLATTRGTDKVAIYEIAADGTCSRSA